MSTAQSQEQCRPVSSLRFRTPSESSDITDSSPALTPNLPLRFFMKPAEEKTTDKTSKLVHINYYYYSYF